MISLFMILPIIAPPLFYQKRLFRLFVVLFYELVSQNGVFFVFLVLSFEFIDILFTEIYNFTIHFIPRLAAQD